MIDRGRKQAVHSWALCWVKAGLKQVWLGSETSLDSTTFLRTIGETASLHLLPMSPLTVRATPPLPPRKFVSRSQSSESHRHTESRGACVHAFCRRVNACNHYLKNRKFSLSPFLSACLSTICLFKFFLNKKGISLCLFVGIFYIHLLFTSFVFLRCLQQILAGCTVCVINKTAVKILTVRPNCQA